MWCLRPLDHETLSNDDTLHPGIGSQARVSDILKASGLTVSLDYHGIAGYEVDPAETNADVWLGKHGHLLGQVSRIKGDGNGTRPDGVPPGHHTPNNQRSRHCE